jgi:hypothetical protein
LGTRSKKAAKKAAKKGSRKKRRSKVPVRELKAVETRLRDLQNAVRALAKAVMRATPTPTTPRP